MSWWIKVGRWSVLIDDESSRAETGMSWRIKVGRRLAWGYETASDGRWQRDGRIRRFMPTWTYRHGLLVVGLILFARWYWLGVVVRLHGRKGGGEGKC